MDEWKSGPPPHVGWWNTAVDPQPHKMGAIWRWWDGKRWSYYAGDSDSAEEAGRMAESKRHPNDTVLWRYYYPKDARVPRIDPAQGYAIWQDKLWVIENGAPVEVKQLPLARHVCDSICERIARAPADVIARLNQITKALLTERPNEVDIDPHRRLPPHITERNIKVELMDARDFTGVAMRPNKPTIQVGEFLIAQADNDPLTTYITNTTTGEGGGFRTKGLAAAIGEFFNREF